MTFTTKIETYTDDGRDLEIVVRFRDGDEPRVLEVFDTTNGVELDPSDPAVRLAFADWLENEAETAA